REALLDLAAGKAFPVAMGDFAQLLALANRQPMGLGENPRGGGRTRVRARVHALDLGAPEPASEPLPPLAPRPAQLHARGSPETASSSVLGVAPWRTRTSRVLVEGRGDQLMTQDRVGRRRSAIRRSADRGPIEETPEP